MTISERSIILMGGKPGSGKTNLSRRLQTALDNPLDKPRRSVEHVSIGEFARQQLILGKQATRSACQTAIIDHLSGPDKLQPFDEDIARGIVYEQLLRSDAEIVLLDGYPRYFPQVDGVFELAARSDFYVKGAIITHVEENEAVRRMMKRTDDRVTSEAEAYQRLAQHEQSFHNVETEIEELLPTKHIDTHYPKERTLVEAYLFATALIGDRLTDQKAG